MLTKAAVLGSWCVTDYESKGGNVTGGHPGTAGPPAAAAL
jgi:hypothetical protein